MKVTALIMPNNQTNTAWRVPRQKQIVVIDDEPKIRRLFTHILCKDGYETVAFGDNVHAIQYLKDSERIIDLLVLDLDMSNVDGRYFCEMARIKHPEAKILIASNYGIDIQKFIIFDADEYFDKSEGIKALKEKVNKVLDQKGEFLKKGGA